MNKYIIDIIIITILVIYLGGLAYTLIDDEPTKVKYDCRIAEISPDVPVNVKEECRRLMER
jgi:hypothetical protein